jgi:transcription initiation factor TFIID subunit 9B
MLGYTSDVFQDSLVYAEHANKNDIDLDDIQLAIQSRVNHSFTTPPPKEVNCYLFDCA